jgi:hypothetical protein
MYKNQKVDYQQIMRIWKFSCFFLHIEILDNIYLCSCHDKIFLIHFICRLVTGIGDTYGAALLLHMLTATINLTLLAYQATKIKAADVYGLTVIGYLVYSLMQVFLFCIFGNRLIEEVKA